MRERRRRGNDTIRSFMTTRFKRLREDTVMCTAQGCSDVAGFFFSADVDSATNRAVAAAYCEAHAADAARRLGHPWPIAERKPAERTGRKAKVRIG